MSTLRNRVYYSIKPYVPRGIRLQIRRWLARRQLARNSARWPIDPAAARQPANWPGWPEGKQFAFVITHDVEGPEGIEKCRALAEIEMEMGFRSSFNFIPEGPYRVPVALRHWLTENGFEVGVHDLHHDGKLFSSQPEFKNKASRINRYLREWNASGFRAGFMLRNLDWYRHLDASYDASTFDTDPFEPQADGTGTIFPFWVPTPSETDSDKGYVELPYSLPQDSTLYLILQENDPAIWLRKLDWIAQHGGMALINVHPDYLHLSGHQSNAPGFPVDHYRALLRHIQNTHPGRYWHQLPKRVASWAAGLTPRPTHRRPKHIGMVTHSFYETDNRVIRYAEALVERGDTVEIFALQKTPNAPREEVLNGVNIIRLQGRDESTRTSAVAYLLHLLRFLLVTGWRVARHHSHRPYDLLHVHNMPDFLVFSALYPKLHGARVILDIHDIVPELYDNKFHTGKTRHTITLLKWLERVSAQFSDHAIISNDLWYDLFTTRTRTTQKCSVFINNVDSKHFQPGLRTRHKDNRYIILFPGGLQWHQGLDIAIHAFKDVAREVPTAEFHIYGEGNMKASLVKLTAELELTDRVLFFSPVPLREIVKIMANADIGVVPKRADSFGNEAYSTKIMEFMAVNTPVVVSRTKIDSYYFPDDTVSFFASGNSRELATTIITLLRSETKRMAQITQAAAYVERNNWSTQRLRYLTLIDQLSSPQELP